MAGLRARHGGRAAGARASPLRGARLRFRGDVPRGSGLSSSAALEAALCLALLAVAEAPEPDRTALAELCSRVENDWVGAETGLLDQLASFHGREDHALRIDFATLALEPVPLELGGWQLVTVESGAAHSHAGSGYNERRAECRAACEALGTSSGQRAPTRTRPPRCPRRSTAAPATCCRRTRASTRPWRRCGRATSRRSAGCSTRRTRACATTTRPPCPRWRTPWRRSIAAGAAGARMVGGGFGGSVLALLRPGAALPEGAVAVAPGPPARVL